MIINGADLVLGRVASFAAKKALLGENIVIVNCEKLIVTGNRKEVLKKYQKRVSKGDPFKGPFFPRQADKIVKRVVRGMLPYKQEKGRKAYKKIMCFIDIPEEYSKEKLESIKEFNIKKLPNLKYISLKKLSELLGK